MGQPPWIWVAIIAIIAWAIVSTVRARFGGRDPVAEWTEAMNMDGDGMSRKTRDALAHCDAEVKALKERVAVLERLATDPRSELDAEFERLRRNKG